MRYPPVIRLIAAIGLSATGVGAHAAAGDDSCFVAHRIDQLPQRKPGASGGERPVRVELILRADPSNAHNVTEVYRTEFEIRGMSLSFDGTELICQEVRQTMAVRGQVNESRLVILKADGTEVSSIDVSKLGVRVFGAPVLLADHKHIGLTVCSLPSDMPAERAAPGRPNRDHTQEWSVGRLPSQPYVAVVDRDGQNLRRLAPGLMPCWAPDGKTVIYSDFTFNDNPANRSLPHYRLFAADSDGKNPHPIAPDLTADGWFSPDGKQIAYIGSWGDMSSKLFVSDADGSNAKVVAADTSLYASPRWLGIGASARLQAVGLPKPTTVGFSRAPANQGGPSFLDCVWAIPLDGSSRAQLSPGGNDLRHFCGIDLDAEALIMLVAKHSTDPGSARGRQPGQGHTPPP